MKTSVDQLSPTRVKLTINVEPAELKPYMDAAYKEIANQVQVPGFRRGKVPAAIIDQRVGREVVLDDAISKGLDEFYQEAMREQDLQVLGRPTADVAERPDPKTMTGDLVVTIETDVRPKVELPKYEGMKIVVDEAKVSDEDVDAELDELRSRFGTLKTVDRPIADEDFVTLDLVANVDGEKVDEADGISYQLGSGQLLEGIDEALLTLTAGEETTFRSTLLGGDHEGEEAEITVKVTAVKERELPEADDEFAEMASEFDTIAELRGDLEAQAKRKKVFEQVEQAREKALAQLLEQTEIPVPQQLIDDEVANHLEQEGKAADDEHGVEVRENAEKSFRQQILLDEVIKAEEVQVQQDELTQFLIQSAAQYGMAPQEFVDILQQSNQLPAMVGEVARSKAILHVLDKAEIVDEAGQKVDISEFTAAVRKPEAEEADEAVDAEAEEKPAAKKTTRKPSAKKADAAEKAEAADAVAEERPAAKKTPARKPAAKKQAAKKDEAKDEAPAADAE
ncbi:Trigger factor [Pseudoclavibacter triregionum]|nr:Trigger factor [Pseudoclavibacter triregionum]